jgi:hypothetical protein
MGLIETGMAVFTIPLIEDSPGDVRLARSVKDVCMSLQMG